MTLKDLISEARIFQNNFIKVNMVEEELIALFGETAPTVEFDENGMFIAMDNFKLRDYDNAGGLKKFSITDAGLIDEIKNIKKYYIEFSKSEKTVSTESEETTQE